MVLSLWDVLRSLVRRVLRILAFAVQTLQRRGILQIPSVRFLDSDEDVAPTRKDEGAPLSLRKSTHLVPSPDSAGDGIPFLAEEMSLYLAHVANRLEQELCSGTIASPSSVSSPSLSSSLADGSLGVSLSGGTLGISLPNWP